MDEIIKTLRSISYQEVKKLLDGKQSLDQSVGIIIVKLDFPNLQNEKGQGYEFFCARVLPKSKTPQHFVNPHYHNHGLEPYIFLKGDDAVMNSGIVKENEVIWKVPSKISEGMIYTVEEKEVHCFVNQGSNYYDFAFACPFTHLVDFDKEKHPEGDRYFTKDLKNGLPEGI